MFTGISEMNADMTIDRRTVLTGLAASAVALVMPRMAFADAVSRAQQHVSAASAELSSLVNSGKSGASLYREFQRIMSKYADMPVVAASCLGRDWRSASSSQKKAYVNAFQGYLAAKYGRQFGDFTNATIQMEGGREVKDKKGRSAGVEVFTTVVRPGQENIGVNWQISERSGSPKAVNLIIEGVSLLSNERQEIGAMLDAQGGSIDGLIQQLQSRAA